MIHVFKLGFLAFALADRNFAVVSQNKVVGVHDFDKIHVKQYAMITLDETRIGFQDVKALVVRHIGGKLFVRKMNLQPMAFINVDVANIFVRNENFAGVDADGQFFLILNEFGEDVAESFGELLQIFAQRLKEVPDGENFVTFRNKIVACSQKNYGSVAVLVSDNLSDLNSVEQAHKRFGFERSESFRRNFFRGTRSKKFLRQVNHRVGRPQWLYSYEITCRVEVGQKSSDFFNVGSKDVSERVH